MSIAPIGDVEEAKRLGSRSIPADKIARSWEICSLLFPEQACAWQVHANSPLVFSTVWATMSLFKTSAHVPARLVALATFATMVFSRSHDWFSADARAALVADGFSPDQANALLSLSMNVKLAECLSVSVFDKKENCVLSLAYHLVWCNAQKAIDGGNTERMDKIRVKIREQLLGSFSPLQVTELTWRVTMCQALISTNDFLVGDKTPHVVPAAASAIPSNVVAPSASSPVLDPQARFRTNSMGGSTSPAQSPVGSPGSIGRGSARSRSGSIAGRGRGLSVNPYDDGASSSSSNAATPPVVEECNVCDTDGKKNALKRVRGHNLCPFCKRVL